MATNENKVGLDPEIAAINAVVLALRDLDDATKQNVIDYVVRRFKLDATPPTDDWAQSASREALPPVPPQGDGEPKKKGAVDEDGLEGISPVAKRWMSRNGFDANALSTLFSLTMDEIDLVAKKVPGKSKKDRMRNVILLKSIAAYLGGGAARVPYEQVKEACSHYSAYDMANFATYLKDMSAEITGTKESGYTLTARGFNAATGLVKDLVNPSSKQP